MSSTAFHAVPRRSGCRCPSCVRGRNARAAAVQHGDNAAATGPTDRGCEGASAPLTVPPPVSADAAAQATWRIHADSKRHGRPAARHGSEPRAAARTRQPGASLPGRRGRPDGVDPDGLVDVLERRREHRGEHPRPAQRPPDRPAGAQYLAAAVLRDRGEQHRRLRQRVLVVLQPDHHSGEHSTTSGSASTRSGPRTRRSNAVASSASSTSSSTRCRACRTPRLGRALRLVTTSRQLGVGGTRGSTCSADPALSQTMSTRPVRRSERYRRP